jgi:universal stress protein A
MNFKHIVFPTDLSKYNEGAMQYASRLAAESGATLHFVRVADTREIGAAAGDVSYLDTAEWEKGRHRDERKLKRMAPTDSGVTFKHHSLMGIPDVEIVAFAVDQKADLIVMASHGRSGISRFVMGSVAEAVMRKAPCPVLVVKQPHQNEVVESPKALVNAAVEH